MTETIYKSDFQIIELNSDTETLIATWQPATDGISEIAFKAEILKRTELIRKRKPKYVIGDQRQNLNAFSPEQQKWIIKPLLIAFKKLENTKYAIIKSADIFVDLSVEHAIEDAGELPFSIKIFGSKEEALAWLYS